MIGNLVYKTYDISTNIEYTSGTRLNLSGVRIIKLVNRPAGVNVWISTDSNGTNLFPLINRGDGWDLPQEMPPLYDLYVFTKGVNPQDKLILTYTGEKNFFSFGSNSVERVGEIESLGNKSQIDINNAIFNYYSRIPLNNTGKIFEKFYYAEYEEIFGSGSIKKNFASFPLSDEMDTIQSLNLLDNEYYRINIFGHWDVGSHGWDDDLMGDISGDSALSQTLHLSLFNNDDNNPITFTKLENTDTTNIKRDTTNLYEVNRFPNPNNMFTFLGLKSFSSSNGRGEKSGELNINFDKIIPGKILNKYKYFALFHSILSWANTDWRTNPGMHASLLITISQAYNNIGINSFKPVQIPNINDNTPSVENTAPTAKQSYYFVYVGNEKLIVNSTMEKPITSTLLTNIPIESIGIEAFGIINNADTATPTFANPLDGYYGLNLESKTISYTAAPPTNECTNGILYFKLTNKLNGDYIGYMIMAATHGSAVNTPAINYQSE